MGAIVSSLAADVGPSRAVVSAGLARLTANLTLAQDAFNALQAGESPAQGPIEDAISALYFGAGSAAASDTLNLVTGWVGRVTADNIDVAANLTALLAYATP